MGIRLHRILALSGTSLFAFTLASCIIVATDERDDDYHRSHRVVSEAHVEEIHEEHAGHDDDHGHHGGLRATATIGSKSGSTLVGNAVFEEMENGVLVHLRVEDTPPGWHAVHVHEVGDCSSDDGKSAGGHFNPGGHAHGSPHAPEHHLGDLGNMWVNEDGVGEHVLLMPGLTVSPGPNSVVGRSIIVHAGADDLMSQPTGAAGGRIGCGEIN